MFTRRDFAAGMTAAVVAVPALSRNAGAWAAVEANVRDYLRPAVARRDFSGVVMLERGLARPLFMIFGQADFERRRPHGPETGFMTASIGKMFTRAALLALEKQGRLAKSDPLARFLPAFPHGNAITIQHLIDHQGGVARDLPPATDLTRSRSIDELVAIVAAQPMVGKPGEGGGYSNNGYRLLAKVIEVAGQGSYDGLVRELVFEPRRMRSSASALDLGRARHRAVGYRPGPGWRTIEREPARSLSNERGAGSFFVTAPDMMRFLRTLPLEPADLDAASRVDPQGRPKPRSVGHDGFGNGFANLAYAYPDENARMVLLGNIQSGLFTPLHADLRRLLMGERVAPPQLPSPGPPAPEDLDLFTGAYDLRPGNPVIVRRLGDRLTVDGGDGAHPLVALGGRRFFMRLRYATLTFAGDRGRPATLIRWARAAAIFR